ncbi:molybdate ABC transporter substrate-binding protein [Rhodopseudomonas sp. WA056]|uniref:molybdate ABC transporter substrate-binding protein n=1 Tax=Rhodopseudomonas sp. WA056 TaxID=2269367 RepID=UPI0013DF6D62|nr:molybdate ABC transporter substrate-binding protein [Rhodopseudomonas sp. WA056]NEW87105.1 molybdate ABC transporter substrate-binding protein [Rhodopseudomonas sp. WA056]
MAWAVRSAVMGLAVVSFAAPAAADETTLAAGAGYRRPIAELAAAYEKQSGDKLLQVYGHMGQVLAQARESTQIALVCGDKAVLGKAGDLGFAQIAPLGLGRLVIAYRKGLALAKPEDVSAPEFKRIGIPDQASAVYGKAGRQFLERSGLAATIDARLVPVATVPQVTSYVASGEVDAGFINATEAIGAAGNIGGYVAVDSKLYDPAEIVCGVRAPAAKAAESFVQFLGTEQARAILQRYGL